MGIFGMFKWAAHKVDPEKAHHQTIHMLHTMPWTAGMWSVHRSEQMAISTRGGIWKFPVGLAAGLDKNAEAIDFFSRLGLGAVEVGTITPKPQIGNPKPRLWRHPKELSLRNRMGFNNDGMDVVYDRIIQSHKSDNCLLGINLGKNKDTPNENAVDDYRVLYEKFAPVGDYLVINISSPNTPGLRDLQSEDALKGILEGLQEVRKKVPRPLYLKIAPELSNEGIDHAISLARTYNLAGLIATNTTIRPDWGEGGVSGKALLVNSQRVRNYILERLEGENDIDLIGVGGFFNFDDIWEYWFNGGKVLQIYTALIYQGPTMLREIEKNIYQVMAKNQFKTLKEMLDNIKFARR